MADLTKDQLRQQNDSLFANNNSGNITAEDLRTFNDEMIDAIATEVNPSLTGSVEVDGSVTATTFFGDGSNLTGVTSEVPSGTISGSSQVDYPLISNIPSGIVSGSSQVSYTGLSNIPSGIVSSSEQLPAGLVSGSSQVSDITGSSLVTASFATQTLTFTKGDGTTFGVSIPDVSGSDISSLNAFTASQEVLNTTFATTGSNTFVGNQIISGNLEMAPNTAIVGQVIDAQEISTPTLLVDTIEVNNATEISVNNDVVVTGILAANSLAAEPADADTFPLEVTDGIGPRIIVNSQNEAIASGFNTLIRGNTRIGSPDYSDQVNITAAPLGILANNISSYSTANTNLIANNQLFLQGISAGVLVSGSLIVSGNLEMAPDTAILGPLFESTGEIATPTLLVDTIEPNTGANITLNGDTIVNGSSTANISAPAQNNEIGIVDMSGASIGGRPYNRTFFGVADYSQFGLNLEDYFAIEYYDGFGYNFGSEFDVNGKQIEIKTVASGSGQTSYVRTTDNYDGTSQVSIGSGNKVAMNGFVEVTGTMDVSGATNFGTSGSNDRLGVYGGIVLRSGSGISTDGAFGPDVPFDAPVQFFGGASFNGSDLTMGGNTINQVGYLEIDGTNVAPGSTLQVEDGNGTPRLQVNNATLKGFTDVDVLVNGNQTVDGKLRVISEEGYGNGIIVANDTAAGNFSMNLGGNAGYSQALFSSYDTNQMTFTTDTNILFENTLANGGKGAGNITFDATASINLNVNEDNKIFANGNMEVSGSNNGPGNTLQVENGTGTPILSVQNATLKGFTGVDVLVNGNQFVNGNISATGSLGIADNSFIISSGSNSIEFNPQLSTPGAAAQVLFNAGNSNFNATGNFNIQCGFVVAIDAGTRIDLNKDTNINGNGTVSGTNLAPGQTFIAKDGTGTNRLEVNNTILSGLTGVDVNINGKTQITDTLTLQNDLIFDNHTMFNYGAYSSNIEQSGSAGVSQSIQLTQDEASGVSVVSGTQITVANAGTYSQTFSAQILADAGADTIYMWWKKNGVNIPNSATKLKLANNEENVMTVNLVDTAAAGDYYEIAWQSTTGDAVLHIEAASGNIPAIPSVIYTITQVR